MVFSSSIFLFLFLPIVLVCYLAVGKVFARNAVLLFSSLFFYAWGEAGYIFVLLVSIFANHQFGLRISKATERGRQVYLFLAIVLNIAVLGYYKYANFVLDNFNFVLQWFSIDPIDYKPIHLPLGISFFTFQAISYVVDI